MTGASALVGVCMQILAYDNNCVKTDPAVVAFYDVGGRLGHCVRMHCCSVRCPLNKDVMAEVLWEACTSWCCCSPQCT
jgi:hypothetical protein